MGYKRINQTNPADPMAVEIYQLENGLTVYLSENHTCSRFSAYIVVRAGSKDDPSHATGTAHLLEHLMCNGTQKFGTSDFKSESVHLNDIQNLYRRLRTAADRATCNSITEQIVRRHQKAAQYQIPKEMFSVYNRLGGGQSGAETSDDDMAYHTNLPSACLEQWAIVESDRFKSPVFRCFGNEVSIVQQEYYTKAMAQETQAFDSARSLLFATHPYRRSSALGSIQNIVQMCPDDVQAFFKKHYIPSHMAIAISGDLHIPTALNIITKHFSRWPDVQPIPRTQWQERPMTTVRRANVCSTAMDSVLIAFRTPGIRHPDALSLQVINNILNSPTAGLLHTHLNSEDKISSSVAILQEHSDYSVQYLWGSPNPGQTHREVERKLLEVVAMLRFGKCDQWLVDAGVAIYTKEREQILLCNDARARMMCGSFLEFKAWDDVLANILRATTLTKRDIMRVANQYYGQSCAIVHEFHRESRRVRSREQSGYICQYNTHGTSALARRVLSMKVPQGKLSFIEEGRDYIRRHVGKGCDLYYVRSGTSKLFKCTVRVDMGDRVERLLSMALPQLHSARTTWKSAIEFRRESFRRGTEISIGVDADETVITLEGLDEHCATSIRQLRFLLTSGIFFSARVKRNMRNRNRYVADRNNDVGNVFQAVKDYNRHGQQSSWLHEISARERCALTAEQVQRLVRKLRGWRHSIEYCGSLSLDDVMNIVQREWMPRSVRPVLPYRSIPFENVHGNRIYIYNMPLAQSLIRIERIANARSEAELPIIELFDEYYGGRTNGIVFQEMREARGLAYEWAAGHFRGARKGDRNIIFGSFACDPSKVGEVLEVFLNLCHNTPALRERFDEVRATVLETYGVGRMMPEAILDRVRAWERRGAVGDPRRSVRERIERLKADDLLAYCKMHLAGDEYRVSIVGDIGKMDMGRVNKYGTVRELRAKEIFSDC